MLGGIDTESAVAHTKEVLEGGLVGGPDDQVRHDPLGERAFVGEDHGRERWEDAIPLVEVTKTQLGKGLPEVVHPADPKFAEVFLVGGS